MKVSGIFVATGPGEAKLLDSSLPALLAQVDELVVVANGPSSRPTDLPENVRVVENDRALGFSANVNKGIAATTGDGPAAPAQAFLSRTTAEAASS